MLLTESTLHELAAERGAGRVSIYLPTHRRGRETEQDPIRLKNLLSEAQDRLVELGMRDKDARDLAAEAKSLLDDAEFWRHQGDGLALFLGNGGAMKYFRLSAPVEEFVFAGDRFCVRPLLASMTRGKRFHVLALSQNNVRLFDCTRSGIREVDLYDVPTSLADALGYDWEQRSLQFHTGGAPTAGAGRRAVQFHGQGGGTDEKDAELEEFLREVDRSISRLLDTTRQPVVLACVAYLAPIFRGVNKHLHLLDNVIEGSPDEKSPEELHAEAMEAIAPYLDAEERRVRDSLAESPHPDGKRIGITEVLPTLREGRAAGIVLATDMPIWGRFEESNGHVEVHDERQPGDEELLDLAVSYAFATGAEVYGVEADAIPDENAPVAALLRY